MMQLQRFNRGVSARLVAAADFKSVVSGDSSLRWVRFPSTPVLGLFDSVR